MDRIGRQLIAERTAQAAADLQASSNKSTSPIEGDKTALGRDLLSLMSEY
jgi:hypothetical protein